MPVDISLHVPGFLERQLREKYHEVAAVRQAPGQAGQHRHPPPGQERRHRRSAGGLPEKIRQHPFLVRGVLVDDDAHHVVLVQVGKDCF